MRVGCNSTENGVELQIDDKRFTLEFPPEVWRDYPENLRKVFVDNYAFLKSLHLPQFLGSVRRIDFETSYPLFKNQIYNCVLNNISFCADVDGASTSENLKNFINLDFSFKDFEVIDFSYDKELDKKAVVPLSFGKESLLSFAVARDLNLEPFPFFSVDKDCARENEYKAVNMELFSKEFNRKVWALKNNTSVIHRAGYWGAPKSEWGYGHLITEFCLNSLPFLHFSNGRYVILGNENSCNDFYMSKEGYKSYPVYDQSSEWLVELTKMVKSLTNNQGRVVSLVEPIYEIAVIKILHKRYPEIGKYQMSCFPDENGYGKHHYWCQHCSKCARIFIFLKANNIDPKGIGFRTDMLKSEFRHLYSIFAAGRKKRLAIGYDASGCGREEQLYSFYLAYKNGVKGELIDEFKKRYLELAKEKEEQWRKKFFSVHSLSSVPSKLRREVSSIYKEELADEK